MEQQSRKRAQLLQEVVRALCLAPDALDCFLAARNAAVEADILQMVAQREAKCAELEAAARNDATLKLRTHIIDKILTLHCPRCSLAFLDFAGCLALTCANCGCGFCGLCQRDCGDDAHQHAANCRWGGGDVFMADEDIPRAQNRWRRHAIGECLAELSAPDRTKVLQDLQRELQDIGLGDLLAQQ